MPPQSRIYLATTNPGKVREFQEATQNLGLALESLPEMHHLTPAIEDGETFEQNARIKAEYYSQFAPGHMVMAEDSGLSVDALNGAPGVYSARYAAVLRCGLKTHENSDDPSNNRALIAQLARLPAGKHTGKYVCTIALALNGKTLATFTGEAHGELLTTPQGTQGFGYDPLFYFPALGRTFAELAVEQKREYSHRGKAFRHFLAWYATADNL